MAKLSPLDFIAKWQDRFAPNTTFKIEEADFQEFATDIADSFGVTVANVPAYQPGTTYAVGNLVRYTPPGQPEAFYYALNPGQLSAPGGNTTDWKVVPGPVLPTALSQSLTLVQAQGLDGNGVVPGRDYLIDFGPDGNGVTQTITVRGVSGEQFDVDGTLEVGGVCLPVTAVDVQAGTWQVPVVPYSRPQVDGLLATKQGAIVAQQKTFIPPGRAGLTRTVFGTHLFTITAGASLVDLPPPLASDVGTLLAVFNVGGSGGGGPLSWQVQLPPGNPPAGYPVSSGPTLLDVVTPPRYVTLFEIVRVPRGFPYYDTVYSYAVLGNSASEPPAGYSDALARAAQLNRVPAQPTTIVTLTAEAATDYGTAASGSFTVDATNCVVGKVVCFSIGAGGSAPSFTNAPAGQPFKFVPANIYAAGQAFSYSLLVRLDRLEVVMLAD